MLGASAFALFWTAALFGPDIPWIVALGIHGISIGAIAFGLIELWTSLLRHTPGGRIALVGIIVSIIGSFASFILLAIGLSVIAITLWSLGSRGVPVPLAVGSVALVASYVLGARIGTEDAPDPSLMAAVLFAVAVISIAMALVMLGLKRASIEQGLRYETATTTP